MQRRESIYRLACIKTSSSNEFDLPCLLHNTRTWRCLWCVEGSGVKIWPMLICSGRAAFVNHTPCSKSLHKITTGVCCFMHCLRHRQLMQSPHAPTDHCLEDAPALKREGGSPMRGEERGNVSLMRGGISDMLRIKPGGGASEEGDRRPRERGEWFNKMYQTYDGRES